MLEELEMPLMTVTVPSDAASLSQLFGRLAEARERAKEVWENYGAYFFTSSDTSAIIGAFDNLGHIHDVSKIAFEFFNSYDEELLTALDYALGEDSSQKNILIDKLLKLPNNKI